MKSKFWGVFRITQTHWLKTTGGSGPLAQWADSNVIDICSWPADTTQDQHLEPCYSLGL